MKTFLAIFALSIVFSVPSEAAPVFKYSCQPRMMNDPAMNDTLNITVSSTVINLKDPGTFWTAKANFHSAESNNKLRYEGLQALENQPFYAQYLVDKAMISGAREGEIKAQATGSRYVQGSYRCTRL